MNRFYLLAAMLLGLLSGAMIETHIAAADEAGLLNRQEPRENLTASGQPTLEQLQALKAAGYTTIINLRRDGEFDAFDERAVVAGLDMDYISIPLANIGSITPADARSLHEALAKASGPVLLHCASGRRVSGLLGIEAYLLHDYSQQQAEELAVSANTPRSAGPVADWIRNNSQDNSQE